MQIWYDGYHTASGERLYNPRSVVCALANNQLANYWVGSGPYDEIFFYVKNKIDDIRNDLVLMVAGEEVEAEIQNYAAVSMELNTKDEIYSAMVVYGLLTYADGKVSIPNKELMDKYRVEREDKAGKGYVNFIFYPERKTADDLIIELKIDSTPDDAIRQIKDKDYILRFRGKLGERQKYTGRILAVGISYNKKTKKHSCKIEVL